MGPKVTERTNTKKIEIQMGIVKRLNKEVASYEKEVATNEAKIQKMRDENRDAFDIKKFEEVLQESYMMIPDSKNRLEKATEDLCVLLEEVGDEPDVDPVVLESARALAGVNADAEGDSAAADAAAEALA